MFASSCDSTTKETTTQPIFTEGCCINEWTKVGEDADGDTTYYLGYETIQKGEEYVYFWTLVDYSKPIDGDLSVKIYPEVDCGTPRKYRYLSWLWHKQSMGEGSFETRTPKDDPKWVYPPPGSSAENMLEAVCNHVK